jgi:hypothetical protein
VRDRSNPHIDQTADEVGYQLTLGDAIWSTPGAQQELNSRRAYSVSQVSPGCPRQPRPLQPTADLRLGEIRSAGSHEVQSALTLNRCHIGVQTVPQEEAGDSLAQDFCLCSNTDC